MSIHKRLAAFTAGLSGLVVAAAIGLSGAGAAYAGTNVGGIEAETMSYPSGSAAVINDSTASAGKALEVTDNVTVQGTITTTAAADHLWLQAHTDAGTTAHYNVIVDGVTVATGASTSWSTWASYDWTGSWAAGTHTVKFAFTNATSTNLYLDRTNFASSNPASPTPPPTAPATETGTLVTSTYTTGYGYWDNTPAGSSTISNPVIHSVAGGTGTWADPVTVAVGHSITNGVDTLDYPAGTRMYVPNLQKYLIVEDTCGDGSSPQTEPCHQLFNNTTGQYAGQNADPGSTVWIDIWVGGNANTSATLTNDCEDRITADHTVIFNPSIQTYKVTTGDISGSTCQTGYGETPQLQ
jgi:hypothetical protein